MNILPVEQVKEKLTLLGLIIDKKPISFKAFKEYADIHQYGNGKNKLFIIYVGHPKENLFAFYPPQTTKAESLKIAYEYYKDCVESEYMCEYNDENVMWGNCGIPISYGAVRCRLEQPSYFDTMKRANELAQMDNQSPLDSGINESY